MGFNKKFINGTVMENQDMQPGSTILPFHPLRHCYRGLGRVPAGGLGNHWAGLGWLVPACLSRQMFGTHRLSSEGRTELRAGQGSSSSSSSSVLGGDTKHCSTGSVYMNTG